MFGWIFWQEPYLTIEQLSKLCEKGELLLSLGLIYAQQKLTNSYLVLL